MKYLPFLQQLRNRTGAAPSPHSDEKEASGTRKALRGFKSAVCSVYEKLFGGKPHKRGDDNGKLAPAEEFKVLGVDLSHLSPRWQYIVCASGVMVFLLLYGYLQELVVMNRFKRSLGWFVTLLQFSGYAFFSWLQRMYTARSANRPKVPLWCYVILSILQALMQGLTNVSMHYLNYPAKTLFKSSRLVLTMLFGFLIMGKRYSRRDYVVVLFMVVGLGTFLQADATTSPNFEVTGVILILLALGADAAILNLQEHCMEVYNASHEEMVYYSYMGAAVVIFVLAVVSGELSKGIEFMRMTGSISTLFMFLLFCGTGFLGVMCATALIKRFGALVSAITTTVRKATTLILSYVLFNNTGTVMHAIGATLFITGLLIKALGAQDKSPSHKHSGSSSTARPSHHHLHNHSSHHPFHTPKAHSVHFVPGSKEHERLLLSHLSDGDGFDEADEELAYSNSFARSRLLKSASAGEFIPNPQTGDSLIV